jgi:hypothetical protein
VGCQPVAGLCVGEGKRCHERPTNPTKHHLSPALPSPTEKAKLEAVPRGSPLQRKVRSPVPAWAMVPAQARE